MRIMRLSWYSASFSRTLNDSLLCCSPDMHTACALCDWTTCVDGAEVLVCGGDVCVCVCVCSGCWCWCWCSARRTFGLGLGDTLSLVTDGTNEETVAVAACVCACAGVPTTTHPSFAARFESASSGRAGAALMLLLLRALETLWRSVSEATSRLSHFKESKIRVHCHCQ